MRPLSRRLAACAAASSVALASVSGCSQGTPQTQAPPHVEQEQGAAQAPGVRLTPAEVAKAGIVTAPAVAARHAPDATGYAVVITRDAIAQAVADLTTAAAVERQSRSALARGRGLAGTPGAMPIESQEAAERQATVDHAALVLAERRLSAIYGGNAPWKGNYNSPTLAALAAGESKLARVTFPLGALGAATPATLRFTRLGETQPGRPFESVAVWSAPADANIPGRSFFAVLKGSDASDGEHLLARASVGEPEAGVLVPFSAVVISEGKYWCYVEAKPGSFVRTEIDTSMPTSEGYFVRAGITPGAQIVTGSAAFLLAREINPSTEAD